MRKIILMLVLAFMIAACERGPENAVFEQPKDLNFVCINGHLYILNRVAYGHQIVTPLFAADTDELRLERCPRKRVDNER